MSAVEPSIQQRTECECGHGMACSNVTPGHAMHLIRRRLASATPSQWRDAIVGSVSTDGWIDLVFIDDSVTVRAWHHSALHAELGQGEPVAVHAKYDVLAVGKNWFNVLVDANQQ